MLTRVDKRALIKRVLIVGTCVGLASFALGHLFVSRVRFAYEQKMTADMLANSQVLATSFNLKSSAMQASLRSIAAQNFILDSTVSKKEKLATLSRFADRKGLIRVGYVELNGQAYTSDNGSFDASDRVWFKEAKAGCSTISSSMFDNLGVNGEIVIFAEPVRIRNNVVAVLFASQYTAEYLNTTQMNLLEKVNRVFVFDNEGMLLAGAEKDQGTYDFFTLTKRNSKEDEYSTFIQNIKGKKSAVSHLSLDNEGYVTAYAPIKQRDGWNVLLALNERDLHQQSFAIIRAFYGWVGAFALLLAILSGFFIWVYFTWREVRDENERLLNKNDLLPQVQGIKSVNALLRDIEHFYIDMTVDELAVVGVITITSLAQYEKVFGEKQLTELRVSLARKNALLANNVCHIAYAGHDEYVIFATGFTSRQECRDYIMKVQAAMTESYEYSGLIIRLESVGGAKIYFKNDERAKQGIRLLECAEYAKTEADRRNKRIFFHDFDMQNQQIKERNLKRDFPLALKRDELTVVYQPQFDIRSHKLIGFDAQLRWNHPEYGIIYPSEFIPMALESGLVIAMGHWLIDHVCKDAQSIASSEVPVSFKVLSLELLADDYADYLIDTVAKNNLPRHSIVISLIDGNISVVYDQAIGTIERMKAAGIDFALDYFGWWLNRVNYVSMLPFSSIRIHRESFDDAGTMTNGCRRVLSSVVNYAEKAHMNVFAKGIKTESQRDAVEAVGIHGIQGDYCGRALTLLKAQELLESEADAEGGRQ